MDQLDVVHLADRYPKKLSGGEKQRAALARALALEPEVILYDEPTAGLDPEERNRFLNLLSEIGENIIVILSTHIVDDVAEVCSLMAIINNGRVVRTGAPQEAIEGIRGRTWKKVIEKSALPEYERDHKVVSKRLRGGQTIIHVLADERPDPSFDGADPDLEDVYFITLSRRNGGNGSPASAGSKSPIEAGGGHTTGTDSGRGR